MARLLDSLKGHGPTLQPLIEAASRDRLAPTLVFSGPSGIGKKLAALALAQALVCEKSRDDACGECGSCLRIEKRQSESLLVVEPDGAQIKIEQARDVLQFISLRSLGRSRVIVIDQAHLLGPQAANALLKSLEEPPNGTFFILVTPLASAILPTIRSRSQMVRFRPLEIPELRSILGKDADEWVLKSARGSVENARRMMEDREEFQELEGAARAYLAASLGAQGFPGTEISNLRELMKDRSTHGFVSSLIQGTIRDALRTRAGIEPLEGERLGAGLLEAMASLSPARLELLSKKAIEFERDLAGNVDRGLVLENFALAMSRA